MRGIDVVVTGVGVVSPLSLDVGDHFDGVVAGRSAVTASLEVSFSELPNQAEARVTGFDRGANIGNRMLRKLLSPTAGYAVGAAGAALRDAGLLDDDRLQRCGLYVGSLSLEVDPELFIAPLRSSLDDSGEFDLSLFARRGMRLLDPLFLLRALPNSGACGISVEHQVLGPNTNLTNGPTSGLGAVALAAAAVARGEVDCAVAGGYDTLLTLDSIAEQLIAKRLSKYDGDPISACRPFDVDRDGFVVGEGAAFVVIEGRPRAEARGATVYAVLEGFGETTDIAQMRTGVAPDGSGLHAAASAALASAGRSADELGVVFGDGLGTPRDDVREALAFDMLRGSDAVFTAATPAIGNTGAASGVFSLIHAAMGRRHGVVPPLANCDDPDPACPVRFLSEPGVLDHESVLVWNSDRGSKNIAAVVSRP